MSSLKHKERPRPAAVSSAEQMARMIRGYWTSQIVGTFAQFEIPDHLATRPMDAGELAPLIACHAGATYRLLRAAKVVGLVQAAPGGKFNLTSLGATLRSNVRDSMRDSAIALTAPGHWLPWGRLRDALRTGRRQTPETLGTELFQYYAENSEEGRAFTGAMSYSSGQIADEVARVLDTSRARDVVDVGGASGGLIAALLARNPLLKGTIIDRPEVVPRARAAIAERGLSARCGVAEADFFVAVPQADIHILKSIVHDWDDDQSVLILCNCARSLRPNGRVVLVELVVPEDGAPTNAPLMDLNMLVLLPGRERTLPEYGDLLARAGLRLDRVTSMYSPFSLLEASIS
jgi:SAM-dependent methyltransferase